MEFKSEWNINTHRISICIFLYFTLLLFLAPFGILSFDTYYYWEWSRHLALSYFDGSPMIAYLIKLSTLLFGDTLFALGFVGIVVTALCTRVIYKTARLFLSKEASYIAMLLWLFSPLVSLDLLKQTTYDTPLALFWALSIYFTVKFIKFNEIKDLYWIGASIGLMLLSKYTGAVLILALIIFLTTTRYRYLYKTPHFYFALLLSLVIFSPVLFWNYQHEWQSFTYQLTSHQSKDPINPLPRAIQTFFKTFLPSLNFMLIPPLLCWVKRVERNLLITTLLRIICTTFLCFYLIAASKAEIRESWLMPYLISSALLGGFCFQTFHYRKSTILLIVAYVMINLGFLLNNTYQLSLTTSKKLIYYHLMQQFNADSIQLPKIILTSGWFEARMLFFLKNKPNIYTIGCGTQQNQYASWSAEIQQKIIDKTLKEALYIDRYERSSCLQHFFDKCERIPTRSYPYKNKEYVIYAYRCVNYDLL